MHVIDVMAMVLDKFFRIEAVKQVINIMAMLMEVTYIVIRLKQ